MCNAYTASTQVVLEKQDEVLMMIIDPFERQGNEKYTRWDLQTHKDLTHYRDISTKVLQLTTQ